MILTRLAAACGLRLLGRVFDILVVSPATWVLETIGSVADWIESDAVR